MPRCHWRSVRLVRRVAGTRSGHWPFQMYPCSSWTMWEKRPFTHRLAGCRGWLAANCSRRQLRTHGRRRTRAAASNVGPWHAASSESCTVLCMYHCVPMRYCGEQAAPTEEANGGVLWRELPDGTLVHAQFGILFDCDRLHHLIAIASPGPRHAPLPALAPNQHGHLSRQQARAQQRQWRATRPPLPDDRRVRLCGRQPVPAAAGLWPGALPAL